MKKSYTHLTQELRDRIAALHTAGHSNREVACVLNIAHTTVGRELRRNSYGSDGRTAKEKQTRYDAAVAQHKAYVRRKYATYQGKKIHENHRFTFVTTKPL